MRLLDTIRKKLEAEVIEYLESCNSEDCYFSDEATLSVFVDGACYEAVVEIEATFRFRPDDLMDDYGNLVTFGHTAELRSYSFRIRELWSFDGEDYLIDDYEERRAA